jgi:hypothetical protein
MICIDKKKVLILSLTCLAIISFKITLVSFSSVNAGVSITRFEICFK